MTSRFVSVVTCHGVARRFGSVCALLGESAQPSSSTWGETSNAGGDTVTTQTVDREFFALFPGAQAFIGASSYHAAMNLLQRVTQDPAVMGGKPCLRGLRVTVGTVLGLLAAGKTAEEILDIYPYLEADDIRAALEYAAWRTQETELPLS